MYMGMRGDQMIFGLPGNPASALICYHEYVLPALKKFQGFENRDSPRLQLPLGQEIRKKTGLTHFLRGAFVKDAQGKTFVMPLPGQNSHMMQSFARADVLIVVPEDVTHLACGDRVEVHPLPGREEPT